MAVMFLDCSDFIAEPDRDFVNAFTGRDKQAGERVPHRVRRNPIASLCAHVFRKGCAEIVTIKTFPVGHVRSENERLAKPVISEEPLKLDGERNRTFFAVLKVDCRCFSKVEPSSVEVEPEGTRFNDLLKS